MYYIMSIDCCIIVNMCVLCANCISCSLTNISAHAVTCCHMRQAGSRTWASSRYTHSSEMLQHDLKTIFCGMLYGGFIALVLLDAVRGTRAKA